jgi:aldose 1-epimerase
LAASPAASPTASPAGASPLDGTTYQLAINHGPNHLHGGQVGFDKRVWQAAVEEGDGAVSLALAYLSKDGEENYPGNLLVTVTYTLMSENTLRISYRASTDQPTILNLTNHTYFNLAGSGTILDHEIMINADHFTPIDEAMIPTGELRPVAGTPFDFRQPRRIGAHIDEPDEQLQRAGGYDHNFVLNGTPGELRLAARLYDPSSGRVLEVSTTEPGMQLYTGNFLDGTIVGKGGGDVCASGWLVPGDTRLPRRAEPFALPQPGVAPRPDVSLRHRLRL